jgi:hypothetical protein
MHLIYNIATGKPRLTVSSLDLADGNLKEGEAHIDVSNSVIDNSLFENVLIVDGQLVQQEAAVLDPVAAARHFRISFLAESDWTQTTDSPLSVSSKEAWARYRQELRDFPASIAAIAADEERSEDLSELHLIEQLLPTQPEA